MNYYQQAAINYPLILRRIKSTGYIPLIPAPSTVLRTGFSLKGEGAPTCVDTFAVTGKLLRLLILRHHLSMALPFSGVLPTSS